MYVCMKWYLFYICTNLGLIMLYVIYVPMNVCRYVWMGVCMYTVASIFHLCESRFDYKALCLPLLQEHYQGIQALPCTLC